MFLSIPGSDLKHFMMANVLKPNKSGENCIRTPHCPSLAMINCWVALFICFPSSLYFLQVFTPESPCSTRPSLTPPSEDPLPWFLHISPLFATLSFSSQPLVVFNTLPILFFYSYSFIWLHTVLVMALGRRIRVNCQDFEFEITACTALSNN